MLQNMRQRDLLIGVAVALGLLVLAPLALMSLMMMGMGGMMGLAGCGAGGMMGPSAVLPGRGGPLLGGWLLVGIGVLLLGIWGTRHLASRSPAAGEETPLGIVQRRYARGEIGAEEYARIRADLSRAGDNQ